MSNIPYADLGETSGEHSGDVVVDEPDLAANSSDDDKLSETGDIGVSDDVCASYQVIYCRMKLIKDVSFRICRDFISYYVTSNHIITHNNQY